MRVYAQLTEQEQRWTRQAAFDYALDHNQVVVLVGIDDDQSALCLVPHNDAITALTVAAVRYGRHIISDVRLVVPDVSVIEYQREHDADVVDSYVRSRDQREVWMYTPGLNVTIIERGETDDHQGGLESPAEPAG